MLENLTGVIGGGDAFLAGNAEIICRNKHLNSAFKLNNGEKPKGEKNSSSVRGNEISVEKSCNRFWEIDIAIAEVALAVFGHAAAENDGRNNLNNRSRIIGGNSCAVDGDFGTEHLDVAFAAVKDNFFGKERDAGDRIGGGNRGVICGKTDFEIESHINGIKSAVERNRFHFKEHVKYFDAFGFYGKGAVDFCLLDFCKINLKILKAIFVNGLCTFNYLKFTIILKGEDLFLSVLL